MSARRKDLSRVESGSSTRSKIEPIFTQVDDLDLYDALLRVTILNYRTEPRYKNPTVVKKAAAVTIPTEPVKLPANFFTLLEKALKAIAMKLYAMKIDDHTRRSLLRFYTDTQLFNEGERKKLERRFVTQPPEDLIVMFIKAANTATKELEASGTIADPKNLVVKHTDTFIKILIQIVQSTGPNGDAVVRKLREYGQKSTARAPDAVEYKFVAPTFNTEDMRALPTLCTVFGLSKDKVHMDVILLKNYVTETAYITDLNQVLTKARKDVGVYSPQDFRSTAAYVDWNDAEMKVLQQEIERFTPHPKQKRQQVALLKAGENYYVLPRSPRDFLYSLIVKLLSKSEGSDAASSNSDEILSPTDMTYICEVARCWRVDASMRACLIHCAANATLLNPASPLDFDAIHTVLHSVRIAFGTTELSLEDELAWFERQPNPVTEAMAANLTQNYGQVMEVVKRDIKMLLESDVLDDYVAAWGKIRYDVFFDSRAVQKWTRRIAKKVEKVTIELYKTFIDEILAEPNLQITHVFSFFLQIVEYIDTTERRFAKPFFDVDVAAITKESMTAWLGEHAQTTLGHVCKNAEISIDDALKTCFVLEDLRAIHGAVSRADFGFNIEAFFLPYAERKVAAEVGLFRECVENAVRQDNLTAEEVPYSPSIKTIFEMIARLKKNVTLLQWKNRYHVAKLNTQLLKGITDGITYYSDKMFEMIVEDLEEGAPLLTDSVKRKSGINNWFAEVTSVVNGMNTVAIEGVAPYSFRHRTCVAVVNLATALHRLEDLERDFNIERISRTVEENDPRARTNFTSHLFTLRIVRATGLAPKANTTPNPYVTLADTNARRRICRTKTASRTVYPEWNEEFEIILPADGEVVVSATVWDESSRGSDDIFGRNTFTLQPSRFDNDGIPREMILQLDSQGTLVIEAAMESQRLDAIFCVGKTRRALSRNIDRAIKLIVEKFHAPIASTFSRATLKTVCGANGTTGADDAAKNRALQGLFAYLGENLAVLNDSLTRELLHKTMLVMWLVILAQADALLLPPLHSKYLLASANALSWSSVSSAVANVAATNGIAGYGRPLSALEMETILFWLEDCKESFHQDGHGPLIKDLKTEKYQMLLLATALHDQSTQELRREVEELAPSFAKLLREKNFVQTGKEPSRVFSIARSRTIMAHGTMKARKKAIAEAELAKSDPTSQNAAKEDIILRILISKNDKEFVSKRLDQRERLAQSINTERLARAAMGKVGQVMQ
ncbi:hypothetical protein BABINDRAFT_158878 [Babjeviella inositovora NRRL Y-12698]|uniref:C2 domain-containing protein n=1 Tax=Babjeviella inositovora NRRL Y-12698 TaxID=984486 RepID=A0A1E3QX37_9ASCO|nr:uncharacterized protein BABINDRAFT_158878 [Babjeviella inositovora NRRL Y-12698]ODQ82243.1 hypothetical protein BABINDRAFT_158878 [Babjeviella inositovora NRRL Y-12698]